MHTSNVQIRQRINTLSADDQEFKGFVFLKRISLLLGAEATL